MAIVRLGIALLLLSTAIMLACSSDDNPIAPKPPDNPVVLDTGGLAQIPGNPTDTASKVLDVIEAHPAPADKIDSDGFMRTRLQGILNPNATIETVNNALIAASAVITFYDTATYSVSLRIPEQATREAADSIGAGLVGTGAFWFLFAGQSVQVAGQGSVSIIPQRPLWTIRHLRKMRMPAAWHVKELASRNSQQVRVIVPDLYASSNPITEIPAQSFLSGNGTIDVSNTGPNGIVVGNHGFHVAGTIAASFDNSGSTGTHPGALQDISVLSLKLGGLGWNEIMGEISQSLPAMPCLVSTSLAYNQLISQRSKTQRALDAIQWRGLVADRQSNFLMFAAAGNNGQAPDDSKLSQYSLPWNLAASFASPNQMVPEVIPVAERAVLDSYFETVTDAVPAAAFALNNVVVVGSSDTLGNLSLFSNTPSSVRAVGEDVCAPCLMDDPGLDTMKCRLIGGITRALYDGTSMATPQVAGLAVYLWNIKPSLSLQELKTTIINAYNPLDPVMPGVIDAYRAVLSLDQNLSNAPVRLALFDVAGSSGVAGSDQKFDEKDLALWFEEFQNRETARIGGADPFDYSRYDLNGNGISAIEAAYVNDLPQLFDLDVNSPPQFSVERTQMIEGQEIKYNENQATDLDILCYNAYSALYTGDIARRTELCLPCLGTFELQLNIAGELQSLQPETLTVKLIRRSPTGVESNAQGVDINVLVQNGSASPYQGITDADGMVLTEITADGTAPRVSIHVEALQNGVLLDSVTIAPSVVSESRVTILEHTMTYAYSHWVLQWDATTPSKSWFTCDSILDSSTVALPAVGANQDDFVSQTSPCESDGGATCQVQLDTRHQLYVDVGLDSSSLEYTFTSSANHSALANDVMDDQHGFASAAKQVEVLFEVTGAIMRLELQFGMDVTEFFPIYNPVNGSSHAYGKVDVVVTNEDDGVTPPFGTGGWASAQAGTWQSGVYTHYIPPGKYRCVIKIDDWVSLYNKKNELPHVTEAKNDTDVDVLVRFTTLGGNGL